MEPKQVALTFLQAFWRADLETSFTLLTPDAKFLLMPTAAEQRENDARVALRMIVDSLFSRFDPATGLHCEVTSLIAEGNEVAIEYTARTRTFRGEPYENFYSAHLTIRDGQVAMLRTYADTRYINRMLSRRERQT